MDPKKCTILVPTAKIVEPLTNDTLAQLQLNGYDVRTLNGCSMVDLARSTMATRAMRAGFEETLWIDSDMKFTVEDVERIRSHNLPIVVGIYTTKGENPRFACKFLREPKRVTFGQGGGLVQIEFAGMGFAYVKKCVYDGIAKDLPVCKGGFNLETVIPYFRPLIVPEGDDEVYLSEDYSFWHRARRAGFAVMADTTLKIGHIGAKVFTWDDMMPQKCHDSLTIEIGTV